MAQSNESKYVEYFDGHGNLVPEEIFDVDIQQNVGNDRDAVLKDLFGNGVTTDTVGWKVDRADLLAVQVSAGSGLVDGQRVVSASNITILGLPTNSTIKIYATALPSPAVYANEIIGWSAMFGWTTGVLMAGTLLLATVVTGPISIASITEGRDIINSQPGAVNVSQNIPPADDAAGVGDRMSMIASRIMAISGAFPPDHAADDPAQPKPWYEQLSDHSRGGPRLAARDRSMYGIGRKFEARLSGATANPAGAPSVTPVISGGSLLDGNYYTVYTWTDDRGDETLPSPQALATINGAGGHGRITVTAPLEPNVQAALGQIAMWHRAYDIVQSDNTAVTSWVGTGTSPLALTQANVGEQPTFQTNEINGRPCVRFDGTDDSVVRSTPLNLTTSHTIVMLMRFTAVTSEYRILGGAGGSLVRHLSAAPHQLWYQYDGSTGNAKFNWLPYPKAGVWYTVRIVRNNTDIALYVDGKLMSLAFKDMTANSPFTFNRLGAYTTFANAFKGDIAELMLATGASFDTNGYGLIVEDYLLSKYYNNDIPITAKLMSAYVSPVSGGPYYKAATAEDDTLSLLSMADTASKILPPVVNTTKNVYSHAHNREPLALPGGTINSGNVLFTPTAEITPANVHGAVRNVNSRKISTTGGTVGPGELSVLTPLAAAHAVPLSVMNAEIAALPPSQVVDNSLTFEGTPWTPENPGELPRGLGTPGGDEFTLFKGTITTHGGLVMLRCDTGVTLEGALTHSNQQYVVEDNGEPVDVNNPDFIIPDWKKVVLVVWRFYRNGALFRENVHAWHSARLDYNAGAFFEFDGFLSVPPYPGAPYKVPRQSYNFIQTLGPVQTTTWGSAFRYCLISPPPKIVDSDVLHQSGTYTYEVRIATLNGSTSFRSVKTQGFYGYEGWLVTELGGGPSLVAVISPGSGWTYQGMTRTTDNFTLTMPINATIGIYANPGGGFGQSITPFNHLTKIATVTTNGSQITAITQHLIPRGNPGKLQIVEIS